MEFTRGQLVELAKNHLNYELRQLRLARDLLREGSLDERTGDLVAEAGYVHCRNLLAFFNTTAERRDDQARQGAKDVIAADYVDWWWKSAVQDAFNEWDLPIRTTDLRQALNAKVMHVGEQRLKGRHTLDFFTACAGIDATWASFRTELKGSSWEHVFVE